MIIGSAVVGLASGIAQWWNSDNAIDASDAEREKIRALYDKIQDPNFDSRSIMPEEIQVIQKYIPETTTYLEEVAPQQVKAASPGAIAGRSAQLSALENLKRMMQQGYDPQTAIELAQAQRAGSAESASARQTAQTEAARRGFGGGPSFYQAGADQAGMDRLAQAQQNALAQAAQRRGQATAQYGALGGDIRNQDVSVEEANIAAINAFNQRTAASKRDWTQQQAGVRNQAQLYNVGEGQRVAEKNAANTYEGAVRNQAMKNTQAQNTYDNAIKKVGGQSQLSNQQTEADFARTEQQNKSVQAATDLAAKLAMYRASPYYKTDEDKYTKG
jgi:hypothetical protein